jgi:hypothetical protein
MTITIKFDNHTLIFNKDETFGNVRERIREILNTKNKLHIKILLNKPLRAFGKLNLEPGVLSPMLSPAKLDRFNIKDGLKFEVTITDDIFVDITKTKLSTPVKNTSLYEVQSTNQNSKRRGKRRELMEKDKEYVYDEGDFPPLS